MHLLRVVNCGQFPFNAGVKRIKTGMLEKKGFIEYLKEKKSKYGTVHSARIGGGGGGGLKERWGRGWIMSGRE